MSCVNVGIKDQRNLMHVESVGHRFPICRIASLAPSLFRFYGNLLRDVTYLTLVSSFSDERDQF
jgi:hypothetical protein